MITKRIIPCLDVKNGRVVKGVNFEGLQGMAIALVTAGLLAMAFMGFSGVDKGLAVLFGVE